MATNDMEKGYQQGPAPAYTVSDTVLPPPAYSQAINDPTVEPPTYESLFGKVKAASSESSGTGDFFKKFIFILLGTIGCTILIGLVMAIPVAMIVVGSIHLHDCPVERFIPIYLLVTGSFWAFLSLMSLVKRCLKHKSEEEESDDNDIIHDKRKVNPLEAVINTFLFAWFIAGHVWVYRAHSKYQSEDPTAANYCYGPLYLFAFWMITGTYIVLVSLCCCITLGGCLALCLNSKKK